MAKDTQLTVTAMKPRAFFVQLTALGCEIDESDAMATLNGNRASLPTQRNGEISRNRVRQVYKKLGLLASVCPGG